MSENSLPALEVEQIIGALDGVANSNVDSFGSTKPLLECITAGVLRGAVVVLGGEGSEARDREEYVSFLKKLLANDCVVLALGYAEQVALDEGLVDKEAAGLCGSGLKRVCELADIPPVLPLGGLDKVGNVVTIASALSGDSTLAVHQLPVVGCDPAGVSAGAVELANTFVGLGVDVFVGLPSVAGSLEEAVKGSGLKDGEHAKHTVLVSLDELADAILEDLEAKREALSI